MVEFSGIEFRHVDNRVMSLRLVQLGLTGAAMFSADGQGAAAVGGALQEAGAGRARQLPPRDAREPRHRRARRSKRSKPRARRRAGRDRVAHGDHDAQPASPTGEVDLARFSEPRRRAGAPRQTVLISDYFEYYRLAAYLVRYTKQQIGLAMGARSLVELFDEPYYAPARRRHPRSRSAGCSRTT